MEVGLAKPIFAFVQLQFLKTDFRGTAVVAAAMKTSGAQRLVCQLL